MKEMFFIQKQYPRLIRNLALWKVKELGIVVVSQIDSYDDSSIIYNNVKIGTIPYTGVVGNFFIPETFTTYLIAYGKDVESDIAAIKKLVSNNNFFTDNKLSDRSIILDKYDLTGLQVMDLFHNRENQPYYNSKSGTNGERFKKFIEIKNA